MKKLIFFFAVIAFVSCTKSTGNTPAPEQSNQYYFQVKGVDLDENTNATPVETLKF